MSDAVVQTLVLDISNFEKNLSKAADGWDELDRLAKQYSQQNPFRKQADDLLKFNSQIKAGGQLFLQNVQAPKLVMAEVTLLIAEYKRVANAQKQASNPGEFKQTQAEIKKLRTEIDALTKQIDKANEQLDKLSKKRNSGQSDKGGLLSKLDIGGTVGQLASGAGLALGGAEVIRRAVTDSAEYGRKLSELSALTGAVGKDLAFLDQQAQALEADSGIVASTILDTFKAVGSIQPELLSSQQALADTTKEVVALAQAGGISLPEAARAALGALNQFGEGADQASRFVNVLAAGALKGSSEIDDTTQALQNSGTAMKAAGLSFEQGNALIQSLAKIMITGSEAGTALRNVLLKLETASDKNLRPSVVGLEKALENAAKKYGNTTELTKAFGTENEIAARHVLDTRREIAALTQELTGTDVAYQQQRTNLNNLATDLSKAGSATTGFFRTLGQSQDGLLRRLTQGYTLFLQNLSNAKSTASVFLDSYINNNSDGLIGALFTAGKSAAQQSDANEVIRKRNAQIAGITKAAQQQVVGETQDLVKLYTQQGTSVPEALRKAAGLIKKQRDQALVDAQASHEQIKREYEKEDVYKRVQYNKRFEESRKTILAAQVAKTKADSEVARLDKLDAERARTLKALQSEGPTDEEKKAAKVAEDQAAKLLAEKTKLQQDLQKLEDDFDKLRLERLDKSSKEYLELKQKIDLKEIEQLRAHLIKQGQEATGYYVKNARTGETKKVNNLNYTLPSDKEAILQQMRDATSPDYYESNTKRLTDLIKSDFTEQLEKDNLARQKKYGDMELELRDKLVAETAKITQDAGESEVDYERRKAETLLQIKLDYYKKILALAEKDPFADQSAVTGFRETIQQIEGELKTVKAQGKTGPTNLFQLFGLTFKDKDGKDITSEVEKQVGEAADLAISTANNILSQQISADQARIDSIDSQLQAKQNEVDVELELQKQGLANNLSVKRQEYAALQAQRQKEVESQRTAQKIQLGINAALQASELALAVAKIFRSEAGIPVIGLIAAGIEVAALFAAFTATISQISSLPKYHDGDEVTHETARNRTISGDRKPDEVDARLRVGEGVIRKRSYQANKRLFRFLNTLDAPVALNDLTAYVKDNPFGMLEEKQQYGLDQINLHYQIQAEANKPDREMHKKQDQVIKGLDNVAQILTQNARISREVLPDGRIKETDEHGNITVSRRV